MANYCRSPVAEQIFKEKYHESEFEFKSRGIIQFDLGGMDVRSQEYLNKLHKKVSFHQPRKVTKKEIQEAYIVYALDLKILMNLNKNYKKHTKKIKLLSLDDENIILSDPYRFNDYDYKEIMEKINYVCSNIDLKI